MNLDQDIRTMLRTRAEGVAAAPMIPDATVRRAQVRKTLMTGSAAVVAAGLVFGGFAASRSLSDNAVPLPPAEDTQENPTVADFPELTVTFVSPTNGFSVMHPDRAVVTPAKAKDDWEPGFDQADEGVDVVETGLAAVFKGASTELPSGMSIGEWVDAIPSDDPSGSYCAAPSGEITIDGRAGWIAECPGEIDVTVGASGRIYLFTLLHDRKDARAVFDAFAGTIDLSPKAATDAPDSTWLELQLNMKGTFVSPLNGYSFKYLDRGGLEPAKELWDPANQQSPIDGLGGSAARYIEQFDIVETGYGAYFMSASTKIPEGVAVDEWVDEAVGKYLPAGCYVPRSEQAPITIDGQPGRVSEACEELAATVVFEGRLYLLKLGFGDGTAEDARTVLDAWVDTIDLTPETAAAP